MKYKIIRTMPAVQQFQVVEAENEEEAYDIAIANEENFEDTWDSEQEPEWHYQTEKINQQEGTE